MSRTDTPPEGGDGGVEQVLTGIPVCGGAAIGVAHCTHEPEPEPGPDGPIDPAAVEAEITRLDVATARARKQIDRLRDRLRFKEDELQRELGPLLDAYDRMLGSTRLRAGMRRRIRDGLASAERAVHDEVEHAANHLLALPEEDAASLQRRASEVREIGRRLRRNLLAAPFRPLGSAVPRGAILLADRLSPAEIALLDPTRIAGIAVEGGGSADHTAVMLASLGIPAVVGVRHLNALASDGTEVALDGARGTVVLNPSPAREEETRRAVSAEARTRQRLGRLRRLPARLLTGEDVELQANLDLPAELPLVARAGASGIGLLRSEFLFLGAETIPDEQAQAAVYRNAIRAMAGDPTTIRLLDWGGEKEGEAMARRLGPLAPEANPALASRGVRVLLGDPDLLDTQLAAILLASDAGPVRILVPLVTNIDEIRSVREALERAARRLRRRGVRLPPGLPPLGVMIETPAAALIADAMALHADFLSIGSNDLTMYTLAVDRGSTAVAPLYDPLHPSVLRLLAGVTEAALRLRRPVSICGEMAGNERLTTLLLGLGLRSFSMNVSALPRVKAVVRAASMDECVALARRALSEIEPRAVASLLPPRRS